MAISTIGTDALAASAVTTTKLASGVPSRSQLPAGTVLQVVNATYGTQVASSTDSFVDTGLTATITPTSSTSKILVLVNQAGCWKTAANSSNMLDINLQRVTVGTLIQFAGALLSTSTALEQSGSVSSSYLDTASTTSAITYKTTFRSRNNTATVYVQYAGVSTSSITLMEIAA